MLKISVFQYLSCRRNEVLKFSWGYSLERRPVDESFEGMTKNRKETWVVK